MQSSVVCPLVVSERSLGERQGAERNKIVTLELWALYDLIFRCFFLILFYWRCKEGFLAAGWFVGIGW